MSAREEMLAAVRDRLPVVPPLPHVPDFASGTGDLVGVFDHVRVGDDVAVLRVDDHTRAGALELSLARPHLWSIEEAAEEWILQQRIAWPLLSHGAARGDVDLALLDIAMPRMPGLQSAREMSRRAPTVRILMLSMYDNEQYFFEALKAGASGYVLTSVADRDLVEGCRAAMRGEPFDCAR